MVLTIETSTTINMKRTIRSWGRNTLGAHMMAVHTGRNCFLNGFMRSS